MDGSRRDDNPNDVSGMSAVTAKTSKSKKVNKNDTSVNKSVISEKVMVTPNPTPQPKESARDNQPQASTTASVRRPSVTSAASKKPEPVKKEPSPVRPAPSKPSPAKS
jgi:hypothetical protein